MAMQFGSGEPVSRLRRALDVKGKMNLGVDETIVPVLQIFDATEPPFRKTGVRWFFDTGVGSTAGEVGRLRIFHQLPIDQVVDYIAFSATAGAGVIQFIVGQGGAAAAGGLPVFTTEIKTIDTGGVIARSIPILTLADTIFPSSINQSFAHTAFDADNLTPGIIRLPIVIPAAKENSPLTNAPTLTIECGKVTQAFRVMVSGLYWDSLPLNSKT